MYTYYSGNSAVRLDLTFFATEMSVVLSHRRLTYELVSLLSTFFLTIQAMECMSFLAAFTDFQQHLKKIKDDLTVEEV